jgi:hypothetical protein
MWAKTAFSVLKRFKTVDARLSLLLKQAFYIPYKKSRYFLKVFLIFRIGFRLFGDFSEISSDVAKDIPQRDYRHKAEVFKRLVLPVSPATQKDSSNKDSPYRKMFPEEKYRSDD